MWYPLAGKPFFILELLRWCVQKDMTFEPEVGNQFNFKPLILEYLLIIEIPRLSKSIYILQISDDNLAPFAK